VAAAAPIASSPQSTSSGNNVAKPAQPTAATRPAARPQYGQTPASQTQPSSQSGTTLREAPKQPKESPPKPAGGGIVRENPF
jgi:hypothetical protein